MSASVQELQPNRILEVGCGRGWTMEHIAKHFPESSVHGLDPSLQNSREGRRNGLDIIPCRLEMYPKGEKTFDLIYSNHVIQHTVDPGKFLRDQRHLLSPGGRIVLIVQDGSVPSNELLFADQNFSFLPENIEALAKANGLHLVNWCSARGNDATHLSALYVFADGVPATGNCATPNADLRKTHHERTRYLEAWSQLDDTLCSRLAPFQKIIHFGAGIFTFAIRNYCRRYWDLVSACTVDDDTGSFEGKPVKPVNMLRPSDDLAVVVGVRPSIQQEIAERLSSQGFHVVRWDDMIAT